MVARLTSAESVSSVLIPELPASKAFVVQFKHDTGTEPARFSGRIEHLNSGRRAHFRSAEELLTILAALLSEFGATSTRSPD